MTAQAIHRVFRFEPLQPGDPERVGRYTLRARLGEGGMGRVFVSFTPGGRPLAIKLIARSAERDPRFLERFAHEAHVAQRVDGSHVAQLLDADVDAQSPWLASAYICGPTLQELVDDTGPLSADDALLIGQGMAKALISIHGAGVIHRDLKPANVILDEAGPKVIDFGIATPASNVSAAEGPMRLGTVPFMSPEHVVGSGVTARSDVFSLGCTLYFLASANLPFEADTEFATKYRIVHDEPDLSVVDPVMREVLRACLAKDPARRPTAAEAAALCLHPIGAPQPGAFLNITQVTSAIRERAEALRALEPRRSHAVTRGHVAPRKRRRGSQATHRIQGMRTLTI